MHHEYPNKGGCFTLESQRQRSMTSTWRSRASKIRRPVRYHTAHGLPYGTESILRRLGGGREDAGGAGDGAVAGASILNACNSVEPSFDRQRAESGGGRRLTRGATGVGAILDVQWLGGRTGPRTQALSSRGRRRVLMPCPASSSSTLPAGWPFPTRRPGAPRRRRAAPVSMRWRRAGRCGRGD